MASLSAFVRWRSIAEDEKAHGEVEHSTSTQSAFHSVTVNSKSNKQWTSPTVFNKIFHSSDDNVTVFQTVVSPTLPLVLRGGTSNVLAYGHSGSGKTHTIIGYDCTHDDRLGLCLSAAKSLFASLVPLNRERGTDCLGIGFSLFELRKNKAVDLLNHRIPCHIRQAADGRTQIRGPTEMLEGGKFRVRPIVKVPCWDFTSLCESVMSALGQREVGRSSVHDQSSRTHAILELEIVTRQLMDLREAVKDRESELVPVGKRAADLMKISSLSCRRVDGNGIWVRDPNPEFDQEALDKAIEKRREFEDRVNTAELEVKRVMEDPARPECLGGRMVFVDLAGSEYQTETARSVSILQTPKEKQEGRQINMDLLALKEVIRARAQGLGRIPYRSSPLTMVLREYFEDEGAVSAIIVTISPAIEQVGATVNSLNYGRLLGAAGSR